MATQLKDLADETIVIILEYLRATDLASVKEVDMTVFNRSRISRAVKYQLEMVYPIACSPSKDQRIPSSPMCLLSSISSSEYGCDVLYVREIKSILLALGSPVPVNGRGYWISTSWIANSKKYFEALNLPESQRKAGAKKIAKIRQRRGSDCLPPWPLMNSDITCAHDTMALTKGARAKKRLMDGKSWFMLRKFYPLGPQFKSTTSMECALCSAKEDEAKRNAMEKVEMELKVRRSSSFSETGPLGSVIARKSGVPTHLLTQKSVSEKTVAHADWSPILSSSPSTTAIDIDMASLSLSPAALPVQFLTDDMQKNLYAGSPDDAQITIIESSAGEPPPCFVQPLLPGSYHLVPRSWLKSWRLFNKDLNATCAPPLDCTSMLCYAHGLLSVPCHVEEYLVGLRKTLLGGLGSYSGEVVEILSDCEWTALQNRLNCLPGFSVRFTLDGDNITWNMRLCSLCTPAASFSTQSPTHRLPKGDASSVF